MKHFIKSIFYFIPCVVLVYVFLIFVWGRFAPQLLKPNLNYKIGSYGHIYSRLQEVKNLNDLDILFLGSSHTFRGFDTRLFEKNDLKVFNLGSSAQTPFQTKVLLNRYLKQLNPKVIFYEVYPATFSIDGVEASLDIIANDKNDINSIEMALSVNNIKVYNTLIYGFISDMFNLNQSFVEPKKKGSDNYISGGYVEKDISYYRYDSYPPQEWDFKEEQFTSFEEILSVIKEKNIKVILVNAPITSALYKSYQNNNTFDSTMKKYGEYYNFNKILNLDDSLHFYDAHHLNKSGVEIFNNKLIEITDLRQHMTADTMDVYK